MRKFVYALGLVPLLLLQPALAQPPTKEPGKKEILKKEDVQKEIKKLEGDLDKLRKQIRETTEKLWKLQGKDPKKFFAGPGSGKIFFMLKGKDLAKPGVADFRKKMEDGLKKWAAGKKKGGPHKMHGKGHCPILSLLMHRLARMHSAWQHHGPPGHGWHHRHRHPWMGYRGLGMHHSHHQWGHHRGPGGFHGSPMPRGPGGLHGSRMPGGQGRGSADIERRLDRLERAIAELSKQLSKRPK